MRSAQFHFPLAALHIGKQRELAAGAVEIVPFAGDVEIVVALEIIGEEPHPALKGHHARADRQKVDLRVGEFAVASRDIGSGEQAVEAEVLCIYL